MEQTDIQSRFAHHPPTGEAIATAHGTVRELCEELAHKLNYMLVEGREKSLAITHLEEAMMWANAAIARTQQIR